MLVAVLFPASSNILASGEPGGSCRRAESNPGMVQESKNNTSKFVTDLKKFDNS